MKAPTKEINDRFFQAIEFLIFTKKISGLGPFCEEYGLNRVRYINMRSGYKPENWNAYKRLDIEAFYVLAKYFNISLEWLLFGIGNMIKNISKKIKEAEEDAEIQN
ncbi:hypothetical protein [Elizabethkingia miricola]|uniref:hypothetical protein n=1 Tax=Elizabethkingia miricola TaxID=172045 RepID=UPI00099A9AF7|nr:hypothetical protein [Elizabethkingia miricola]OPC34622.1 hypothetical protein BAX99_07065 [Elizabethkingia miricola]